MQLIIGIVIKYVTHHTNLTQNESGRTSIFEIEILPITACIAKYPNRDTIIFSKSNNYKHLMYDFIKKV